MGDNGALHDFVSENAITMRCKLYVNVTRLVCAILVLIPSSKLSQTQERVYRGHKTLNHYT